MAATITLGYFVFDVPLKGVSWSSCLVALLFLAGTSSLGILLSAATRVQVLSVQAAMVVTYLPSFILSGFIFPIKSMPIVVQAITYLVPAKYLIVRHKGNRSQGCERRSFMDADRVSCHLRAPRARRERAQTLDAASGGAVMKWIRGNILKSMVIKEFKQVLRDRRMIGVLFGSPWRCSSSSVTRRTRT